MATSIGSIATPEERAEMKQAIRDALQASGKYDELVAKAREALIDCGWGEQMAAMARTLIQEQKAAGKDNMDEVIKKLSTDFKNLPGDVRKKIKKEIKDWLNENSDFQSLMAV